MKKGAAVDPVPGTTLPLVVVESVDAELMKPMAVLLDDPNQIHLDPAVVRGLGFGDRVINQGPSNCGYVMDALLSALPDHRIRSFRGRFVANVFSGDRLEISSEIQDVGNGQHVTCVFAMRNQEDSVVLDGSAVLVPRT